MLGASERLHDGVGIAILKRLGVSLCSACTVYELHLVVLGIALHLGKLRLELVERGHLSLRRLAVGALLNGLVHLPGKALRVRILLRLTYNDMGAESAQGHVRSPHLSGERLASCDPVFLLLLPLRLRRLVRSLVDEAAIALLDEVLHQVGAGATRLHAMM